MAQQPTSTRENSTVKYLAVSTSTKDVDAGILIR
jgi:hypothetical protein